MKRDLPTQKVCISSSSKSFPSAAALQEHSRAGYTDNRLLGRSTRNVCILAACWVSLSSIQVIRLETDGRFCTFHLHRELEVGYPKSFAHKHPGLRISLARQGDNRTMFPRECPWEHLDSGVTE